MRGVLINLIYPMATQAPAVGAPKENEAENQDKKRISSPKTYYRNKSTNIPAFLSHKQSQPTARYSLVKRQLSDLHAWTNAQR